MSDENSLYKILGLYKNKEFMELISSLQKEALFCDTCYLPNKNPFTFIRYSFFQEIISENITLEDLFPNTPVTSGKIIKLKFPIQTDAIITAKISYPLEGDTSIPLCDFYESFRCNPGLYCCKFPNIIFELVTVDNNKYRLKGRIVKMIVSNVQSDLYEYCIKLSCCNCFFGLVINNTFISCSVTILPIGRSENLDSKFITANQFVV